MYLRAKFERHRRRMSQQDVAIRSRINQATVSAIENGRVNPSAAELAALSKVFGVAPELLMKPVTLPESDVEPGTEEHAMAHG